MSETPSARAPLVLAAASALGVIAFHLHLVATHSVDVPFLDDWDALLGFQLYWSRAESVGAHLRLLLDPHNEHLLALPRAAVLGVVALTGRVDFTWLNLIGNAFGVVLLAALWSSFWRERPASERALAFLPAVFVIMQPQAWTAVLSPTVSLSNLGVMAFAAACYAALDRREGARIGAAAACAGAAIFSSANGILVAPLGSAILWLRGEKRLATIWGAVALAAAAAYLLAARSDYAASDPLAALGHPLELSLYALNFMGSALAFGQPLAAALAGAALAVSFALLCARGLPQRSPVIFALTLLLCASIAANALVRAQQGAAAPLFQPRYRLYSATLLALGMLGWAEVLRERWRAPLRAAVLAGAVVFWGACVLGGQPAVRRHAGELEEGLAHWWQTGAGGLRHPDARKAEFFLHGALDAGWLRLPKNWRDRFGQPPHPSQPATTRTAVTIGFDAVAERADWLTIVGRARGTGDSSGQEVEIVLATDVAEFAAPALSVTRQEQSGANRPRGRAAAPAGFHAYIDTSSLPAGKYRLGVLIRQGERQHFAWTDETLDIGHDRRPPETL